MRETLVQLPVVVPPRFAEACGYRGSARFVALRWCEESGELWLSDDGETTLGSAATMPRLWRHEGGDSAHERFRAERVRQGRSPWLIVDREHGVLLLATALGALRLVTAQAGASERGRRQ